MAEDIKQDIEYGSDSIRTLDWKEHIRRRPGMYIGKLGDGTHADDGIYVLLKEVIDNAIDEFMMGYGKTSHHRHRRRTGIGTRLRTGNPSRQSRRRLF